MARRADCTDGPTYGSLSADLLAPWDPVFFCGVVVPPEPRFIPWGLPLPKPRCVDDLLVPLLSRRVVEP